MPRDPVRYHALAIHATPARAVDAARVHKGSHLSQYQRAELARILRANKTIGNRPRCRFSNVLGYFVWSI